MSNNIFPANVMSGPLPPKLLETRRALQLVLLRAFSSNITIMVSSNDVQRLFLQSILSRGFLSEKLAMTLWTKSIEAVKGELRLGCVWWHSTFVRHNSRR